ncbi:hypothetical protein KM043_002907 [Ampulex compressa]|nr:hypothetical protein KM043_002907 [Ampulex compressa]
MGIILAGWYEEKEKGRSPSLTAACLEADVPSNRREGKTFRRYGRRRLERGPKKEEGAGGAEGMEKSGVAAVMRGGAEEVARRWRGGERAASRWKYRGPAE